MRLLLTAALAATLMGCSFAPQQTAWLSGCGEATAFACSDSASLKMDSKALHGEVIAAKKNEVRPQANSDTKTARSDILLKTDASSSSSQPDTAITTSSIAVMPETPQTSQFSDQSDPAIKKAKATITAKMGNPASVEFVEPPVQMHLAILATSFAASSGRKTADPGRFYILFQETKRISAVTI